MTIRKEWVFAAAASLALAGNAAAQDSFGQQPPPPQDPYAQQGYPPPPGGYPQQQGAYPQRPGGYPQQPGQYPRQPGTTGPNLDQLTQMERQDYGVAPTKQLHSGALHGPTPASIPGGQVITTKGLVELVQGGQAPYMLFDVLGGPETLPGAMPVAWASQGGSFNDPVQQQLAQALQRGTEGRKDLPLVFYCLSTECWMSYNAALRAINLGYSNVLWYRGGIEAWQMAGLPTQPAGQMPMQAPPQPARQMPVQAPPQPSRQMPVQAPPQPARQTPVQAPPQRNPEQTRFTEAAQEGQLSWLDFIDPETGMVQHRAPFPEGWSYDANPNDQLIATGPNGVEVYESSSGHILYSDDPFALQSARMTGAQTGPVVSLGQYLQQQFAPYMEQRGFRMIRHYPMPKVRDIWAVFAAGMPQGLSRKQFDAIGVEWENNNGLRAFTILVQSILQQQKYINWSVSVNELFAPKSSYDGARDAYAYASAHVEVNPRWQIAKNNELLARLAADKQMWDERMRQSQIRHVGRMNAILARGQSSSSVAEINSDILDISHAGYLKRSDMVSAGQVKTINMIGEQAVITNPGTGELYKVDSGYRNYWVNAEGKYFPTDDVLYDPRTDVQISDQQWERFEVVQ